MANYKFVKDDPDIKFINPYNFIPADWKETKRDSIVGSKGNLSGMMKCRLITKTPIAIPDTEKSVTDESKHVTYPFMEDPDGKHMIPGSSLRGVIRSVYETVTDSCFVTVDPAQRITKRASMSESGTPGLLEFDSQDDQWVLYEAERYPIMMHSNEKRYRKFGEADGAYADYKKYTRDDLINKFGGYGEKVRFTHVEETYINKREIPLGKIVVEIGKGQAEGYLYIGEVPPLDPQGRVQTTKHFEDIFSFARDERTKVKKKKENNQQARYGDYQCSYFIVQRRWGESQQERIGVVFRRGKTDPE